MEYSRELYNQEVGRRIKEARKDNGESQALLVELLSRSQSVISQMEKGNRAIPSFDLELIAKHYDLPITHFLPNLEDVRLLDNEYLSRVTTLTNFRRSKY
tara:strand:- start:2310 stop:2609 length:300 start_codon:yes stop_codon:yes gene_type:complete